MAKAKQPTAAINLTPIQKAIALIEGVEEHYINTAKGKGKEFKTRVDAILTATTVIRMKIEELLLPIEKQALEQFYMAGQKDSGLRPSEHDATAHYLKTYPPVKKK